jgi:dephospho-CoA kinase
VIGLIGGIGAGKSRAAALFAERGAFVLDADAVGHALLEQRPARDRVIARFGKRIVAPAPDPDAPPVIDRRTLGAIVFANPAERRALEAILHPLMRRTVEKAIERTVRKRQSPAIVLDAAILLEAGWNSLCDLVVYVDAPREQRLARLEAQRGWTEETLLAREAAQWTAEKKRAAADAVLTNDSDVEALGDQVDRFWQTHVASAKGAGRGVEPRSARRGVKAVSLVQSTQEPKGPPRRR